MILTDWFDVFFQVDGYVEHSTPENLIKRRFCLGALTNLQGKEVCEITRQHIG